MWEMLARQLKLEALTREKRLLGRYATPVLTPIEGNVWMPEDIAGQCVPAVRD